MFLAQAPIWIFFRYLNIDYWIPAYQGNDGRVVSENPWFRLRRVRSLPGKSLTKRSRNIKEILASEASLQTDKSMNWVFLTLRFGNQTKIQRSRHPGMEAGIQRHGWYLNDHVESFITPADEKRARVGWIVTRIHREGRDAGCARFAYPPYGPESGLLFHSNSKEVLVTGFPLIKGMTGE